MIRTSTMRESDLFQSMKTEGLQPIKIAFPISEQFLNLTLAGCEELQTKRTMKKLRQKQHNIPKAVVMKCLILSLSALLLFYAFIILIAVTLFNLILMIILASLMVKYLKWMVRSLREMRADLNMKQIKLFLDHQNQRLYSSKLLRFQLVESEQCIRILNLRFWQCQTY